MGKMMTRKNKENKQISVGGQALMEGIMMRGPRGLSMSLRLPDGTIETSNREIKQLKDRFKPLGWPFIRGVIGFVESMVLGYRCLMESAEKTGFDLNDDQEKMSKLDKWITNHFGPKMMSAIGIISAVLGFGLAFLLFFWLPTFMFNLINSSGSITVWKTVIEGLIRIIIFVSYMALVAQIKDIKRLYMYHGAEHKAIFCLERGEELTIENVRKQKRFHPRCGTSFLFVMIILSILISSIVIFIFPELAEKTALWMLVKLMIVPVIMSIGYEFIKYAGCHQNILIKTFSAPGLWMQRITTKEPTDDIIEVGIEALKAVLEEPAVDNGKLGDTTQMNDDGTAQNTSNQDNDHNNSVSLKENYESS
jgi:uncharacterized protein YqhQ